MTKWHLSWLQRWLGFAMWIHFLNIRILCNNFQQFTWIQPYWVALVWHGTVLNWSREHEDIPSLSLYLYCVFKELLPVVRVPGVDVGPRQDGSGAILLGEISDKIHNHADSRMSKIISINHSFEEQRSSGWLVSFFYFKHSHISHHYLLILIGKYLQSKPKLMT